MKVTDENLVLMTAQQLRGIISEEVRGIISEFITTSSSNVFPKYESTTAECGTKLIGLRELSKHIGCGINTAQKLKDEGKVPYSQIGNRFYFYSNEVDVALRKF